MNTRQMTYFAAIASAGSFSAAARMLRVSQPALSVQMRQLEEELGTELFVRTSTATSLTEHGRVLLERVSRIQEQVAEASEAVRHSRDGSGGILTIGFVETAGCRLMSGLLRSYRQHRPEVSLRLRSMSSPQQVAALGTGELDCGLLHPVGAQDWLAQHLVRRDRMLAVVPGDGPLTRKRNLSWSDLQADDFILFDLHLAGSPRAWLTEVCGGGQLLPRIRHQVGDLHTLFDIVAAGAGVSVLPASIAEWNHPGIRLKPLACSTYQLDTVVAYPAARASPLVEDLAAFAEETAGQTQRRR